jgi:hypothetical protein
MLQLLAEGGQNEVGRDHREPAAYLFHEGLAWDRAFLALGTASDEIRELVLRTYVYAADNQSARQDAQAASKLYDAGLSQARAFLAAGEKNSTVREWALWLFYNSGEYRSGQGDRAAALRCYREGLAQAGAFLAVGDSSAGVLDRLRALADAVEHCEATRQSSRLRDTFVTIAAAWLTDASGDPLIATSDGIRERLLSRLERISRHHKVLDEFCAFLEICMLDWHRRECPHDLFGSAVVIDYGELSPTETAIAALQGLLLWECMQANGRTQALYREMRCLIADVTRACRPWSVQRLISRLPPPKRSRYQQESAVVRLGYQRSMVPWRRRKPGPPVLTRRKAVISDAPALWDRYRRLLVGPMPGGLVAWIVDRYCEELDLGHYCTARELALLSAVTDVAAANEDRFHQPADWLVCCPPWQEADQRDDFLGLLGAAISDRSSVQADSERSENSSATTTTAERVKQLDDAWARVRLDTERLDRVTSALKVGSGLDVLAPPVRRMSEPGIGEAVLDPDRALLRELMAWQGINDGICQEAELLLGAVVVCELHRGSTGVQQGNSEDSLIKQWLENGPPWLPSDAPTPTFMLTLSRAWSHTSESPLRPVVALLKIPGQKHQPIRGWLKQLGVLGQLNLDPVLLTRNRTVLDQAFRQCEDGTPDELVSLLDGAWERARRKAQILARLKVVLPDALINDALADAIGSADTDRSITQRNFRSALVAVLRGDVGAHLSPAVASHLAERARQPRFRLALNARLRGQARQHLTEHVIKALDDTVKMSPSDALPHLVGAVERGFAAAVHLHPGRPHESELTDRLHRWTLAALREASVHEDPEAVWWALEGGRVALSGLAVLPPDDTWMRETAEALRATLRFSVSGDRKDPGWHRGWPPLAAWISRSEELRGAAASSWRACQARLRHDEALVQPYFDPVSGALRALWLTAGGGLECRRFADRLDDFASDEAQWREHVLEPWALWLDEVLRDPSARAWRNPGTSREGDRPASHADQWDAILKHPPVRAFAETLASWADAAGVARLIVLFPAPLAQLPWESLPDSPLPPGRLVRAVSLSQWRHDGRDSRPWRKVSDRATCQPVTGRWTLYDARGLDFAGLEAYCVDPRPYANSDCTSVAVLTGFNGHRKAHVILHGRYQRFAPLRSGLIVHPDQFLPLWAIAAIGVDCPLVVLSACESNLSGRAAANLLGPVGIGPACIAAGAEAVLGTLWPCHDLAGVGFVAYLNQLQGESAWKDADLTIQVAEAARRLRIMSGSDIRHLVERLAAAAGKSFKEYQRPPWQDFYDRPRPFEKPQYWAPYVVLGEPSQTDL